MKTSDHPPGDNFQMVSSQSVMEYEELDKNPQQDLNHTINYDQIPTQHDTYKDVNYGSTPSIAPNRYTQQSIAYGSTRISQPYEGLDNAPESSAMNKQGSIYSTSPVAYSQPYPPSYISPQPSYVHPSISYQQFPHSSGQNYYTDHLSGGLDGQYIIHSPHTAYPSNAYYYSPHHPSSSAVGYHYPTMGYHSYPYSSANNINPHPPISSFSDTHNDATNASRDFSSLPSAGDPPPPVENSQHVPNYPATALPYNPSLSYDIHTNTTATRPYPDIINYDSVTAYPGNYYFAYQSPYHYPVNLYNPHQPFRSSVHPPLPSVPKLSYTPNTAHHYSNPQQVPYYLSNSIMNPPYSHYNFAPAPPPISYDYQQQHINPYIPQTHLSKTVPYNSAAATTSISDSSNAHPNSYYQKGWYNSDTKTMTNSTLVETFPLDTHNNSSTHSENTNPTDSSPLRPTPLELPPNSMGPVTQYPHDNILISSQKQPNSNADTDTVNTPPLLTNAPPLHTPPPSNMITSHQLKKGKAYDQDSKFNKTPINKSPVPSQPPTPPNNYMEAEKSSTTLTQTIEPSSGAFPSSCFSPTANSEPTLPPSLPPPQEVEPKKTINNTAHKNNKKNNPPTPNADTAETTEKFHYQQDEDTPLYTQPANQPTPKNSTSNSPSRAIISQEKHSSHINTIDKPYNSLQKPAEQKRWNKNQNTNKNPRSQFMSNDINSSTPTHHRTHDSAKNSYSYSPNEHEAPNSQHPKYHHRDTKVANLPPKNFKVNNMHDLQRVESDRPNPTSASSRSPILRENAHTSQYSLHNDHKHTQVRSFLPYSTDISNGNQKLFIFSGKSSKGRKDKPKDTFSRNNRASFQPADPMNQNFQPIGHTGTTATKRDPHNNKQNYLRNPNDTTTTPRNTDTEKATDKHTEKIKTMNSDTHKRHQEINQDNFPAV